jgi:peptidoglycan/xylan/chitin deacetylase (PgdA/CDA1 family)
MSVMLVMYHYVRVVGQSGFPEVFALTPDQFRGQVEYLLRWHEPVSPDELLARLNDGAFPPSNAFLLTFDDGLIEHYHEVLPVLERHGLKAIFAPIGQPYLFGTVPFVQKNQFVRGRVGQDALPELYIAKARHVAPEVPVRDWIENAPVINYNVGSPLYLRYKYATNRLIPWSVCVRVMDALFSDLIGEEDGFIEEQYLSRKQIQDIRKMGHTVAAHTIHHPSLPRMGYEDQRREILESLEWIGELLGERPEWLDYPYGDYDQASQRAARDLGVSVAYSTRPPLWESSMQRLGVPRIDTCLLPVNADAPLCEWSSRLRLDQQDAVMPP